MRVLQTLGRHVLYLMTLSGLAICQGCIDVESSTPTDAIRVGALLPFSGELAASGINLERPLMMAADTINEAGGIQGKPVVIVAADSNVLFEDAEDYDANKLIVAEWAQANNLKAVIGPLIPELAKRLAPELRKAGAVHISGSVAERLTGLPASTRCSFNFLPSFKRLGDQLGEQMVEDGSTTAGVIHLTDDYGTKMKEYISAGFATAGGSVTGISPTTLGKPSYVDDITNAIADSPDALVMVAYPKTGSSIVTESLLTTRELPRWYLAPSLRVNDFVANVPKGRLNGALGVAPGLDDRSVDFSRRYRDEWSGTPLLDGYYYFDAMVTLSLAMNQAAIADGGEPTFETTCASMESVTSGGVEVTWTNLADGFNALQAGESVNYEGLSGPFTLDEFGNLDEGFIEIWTVNDDGIVSETRVQF